MEFDNLKIYTALRCLFPVEEKWMVTWNYIGHDDSEIAITLSATKRDKGVFGDNTEDPYICLYSGQCSDFETAYGRLKIKKEEYDASKKAA